MNRIKFESQEASLYSLNNFIKDYGTVVNDWRISYNCLFAYKFKPDKEVIATAITHSMLFDYRAVTNKKGQLSIQAPIFGIGQIQLFNTIVTVYIPDTLLTLLPDIYAVIDNFISLLCVYHSLKVTEINYFIFALKNENNKYLK